jgi:hypothetical protein
MRRHASDAVLIQAVRKRLLDELRSKHGGGQAHQNVNVYGGGGNPGGMAGGMHDESPAESDRDYYVDIMREDLGQNPETGKPKGFRKKVHRFSSAGGDGDPFDPTFGKKKS